MTLLTRKYCGNIGGLTHLIGNFCLLTKGLIAAMFAGQIFDLSPLLTQWPATLSGLIFLFTASMLIFYGHLKKGFILSYGLALIGYAILGGDAIVHHGSVATFLGLGIGIASSLYVLITTQKTNFRFFSVNTRYLNRKFKKYLATSIEKFPFWPSGIIEFIADSALLVGAISTGDGVMIMIAGFWAFGSLLLAGALPNLAAA